MTTTFGLLIVVFFLFVPYYQSFLDFSGLFSEESLSFFFFLSFSQIANHKKKYIYTTITTTTKDAYQTLGTNIEGIFSF